jgi:hypothetical protein
MHYSSLVFTICVAFCYINIASASVYGVDCECICCIPSKPNCTDSDLGYIHLNETVCDLSKCVQTCEEIYPLCETGKGEMHATCTDS